MVRVRRCGFVVVVATVLATAVACIADTTYSGNTTGPRVAIAGDDVISAAAARLHTALDPTAQVRILGLDMVNSAGLQSFIPDVAATLPDVVVLSAGTRDAMAGVDPQTTLGNLDRLAAAFPAACKVVVNLNTHVVAPSFSAAAATTVNAGLRLRFDEVIDWNARVGADVDGMTSDDSKLVPSSAGQDVLTSQVQTAVSRCQQRPAPLGNRLASYGNNFPAGCHTITDCPIDDNGERQPGFWAAISYPYASHQGGDPYASRCWGDSASSTACTSPPVFDNLKNTGNPTNDIRPNPAPPFGDPTWNPEYHPDGYVYGIVVPHAPATVTVELYDASCDTDASDTAGDFNCLGQTPTDFQLYDLSGHAGVVAPPSNAFSGCRKVAASNDATYRNRWTTLCTFRTNTAGTYPLRVRTDDIPVDQPSGFAGCSFTDVRTPSGCVGNGVNAFAIRASGTPGVTVTPLDAGSMWLDPNASIDLADIEPATTDRLLAVDVFDPGDGSLGSSPPFASVSLSQPNPTTGSQLGAQPVPACVWMGSDVRGGPNVQSGASDLCSITTFNTTSRPFSKFNNQWLRIVVPIPAGYTCPPASDACWWRLRYSGPMADRLSYTARIVGDVIP